MSENNAPRMRRPRWRDPRLGVGILLVVASVALGSWAVSSANRTVEVYQAREALSPGDPIDPEVLQVVEVRLADLESHYLRPDQALSSSAVAIRSVGSQELVPAAAVGTAEVLSLRPVLVQVSATLAAALAEGSRVELWFAAPNPAATGGAPQTPDLLVPVALVREVSEESTVFGVSGSEVQVQVLVEQEELPQVLAALESDGVVTVVPVLGSDG